MVNDKQQKEHEPGDNGTENSFRVNARQGRDHPLAIGRRLPVPRSESNVDAVNTPHTVLRLIYAGQVRESRANDHCDQRIVGRQERSQLPCQVAPLFGKMQRPGHVKGDQTDHERGVLRPTVQVVGLLGQVDRFKQVFKRSKDECDRNKEFKDLTRKRRHFPHETHEPNHGRDNVHESSPDADPKEKGKVLRVEFFRQTVGGSEQNGNGSSDAHNYDRLSRENGVNDSNDRAGKESVCENIK